MNLPSRHLIEDGAIPSRAEFVKSKVKLKLGLKLGKIPSEIYDLLLACDGNSTIEEIANKVGKPPQEVEAMLLKIAFNKYQGYDVITFTYLNPGAAEKLPQQQPEKQPQSIFDKAFGDSIICPACGAKSTGKFCSECGATLGSQENQVQRKDKVVKKTKVPQVRR